MIALQKFERSFIASAGAHGSEEAGNGLNIVVEDIRRGLGKHRHRVLHIFLEIRNQNFYPAVRIDLPDAADACGEMPCPAVRNIVTRHAGQHRVAESQLPDGIGEERGLCGIQGQRPPVTDIAVGAVPRADTAHQKKSGSSGREALADIRASGFFADRGKRKPFFHFPVVAGS